MKVNVNVYSESDNSKQQFLNVEIKNTTGVAVTNYDYRNGWDWSIKYPGQITLFTSVRYTNGKYEKSNDYSRYSSDDFMHVSAHEFGHTLGLGDAYKSKTRESEVPDWATSKEDIMRNNSIVTNTDIRMLLHAQRNNEMQRFAQERDDSRLYYN